MLVVSVQMNTLECVYVKLMLYNIKSMFDGLMQNGRGPSCRSPALPLLRLGPRSTGAASRLQTSSGTIGTASCSSIKASSLAGSSGVRIASWGHLVGSLPGSGEGIILCACMPGAGACVTVTLIPLLFLFLITPSFYF